MTRYIAITIAFFAPFYALHAALGEDVSAPFIQEGVLE